MHMSSQSRIDKFFPYCLIMYLSCFKVRMSEGLLGCYSTEKKHELLLLNTKQGVH